MLKEIYGDEFEAIENRNTGKPIQRVGLALSGGGIRGAAFSIGILQGLHEIGALEDIGYLSSVSGGGYAAAWMITHYRKGHYFRELFRPSSEHLRHVTQNG